MRASIFFLWLVSIPLSIHAIPNPNGFFLNCGGTKPEVLGGLIYNTDDNFISIGEKAVIKEDNLTALLSTLRFFPNEKANKYCYPFQVESGSKFLVKTFYYYGGYDGGTEPPVFDQIIDGSKWSTVNTTEDYKNGQTSYYEVIVMAHTKELSVCVARNQYTTSHPFISALEIVKLDNSLYNSTDFNHYALVTVARSDFGSPVDDVIRYPDDQFNRYWQPYKDDNPTTSSHSNITSSSFWNIPPVKAFGSGVTTSRGKTLTINWPPFSIPDSLYYIALYLQDSRTSSPYSWRVFDISINGQIFYSNLNVTASGVTVYGTKWPLKQDTAITLTPRADSPVGPIINAGEVYQLLALGNRTVLSDAVAMLEIASKFQNPPEDWHGDPCMPKENAWTGVKCMPDEEGLRVVAIDVTDFGVSGTLSPYISNLNALTDIWLGNNKLTGLLPDLSPLLYLQALHLENNQFEGQIPESLGSLHHLHEIFLQNNKLTGTVPTLLTDNHGLTLQVTPGNNLTGVEEGRAVAGGDL